MSAEGGGGDTGHAGQPKVLATPTDVDMTPCVIEDTAGTPDDVDPWLDPEQTKPLDDVEE